MARRKREPMSERKKNIIAELIEEYDIRTAKDIEDALRDLMGGTIQEMLEAELDEHLGYRSYERSDSSNYRNGKKTKKIRGNLGETEIEVPQDRDGTFEPKVVKKRQKDISGIEQKIISLEVYPIVFIDAVHFSVRDNGQIRKLAAYVILAVSLTGHKEVLSIHIGENESAKYWLGVLNELKNRGVKDVLVICADGLSGMKEAVNTAFPQTELQRCIVHQVRNTLKYVGAKNKKEFANDLKTIYHAPSEEAALKQLERVTEKWEKDDPNAMKSWYKNWDVISPIFKFSADVRKVIYTTNAIESLNSGYRRLNKQRSVFPSDTALLKALYLSTHEITKKWTMPLRNWGRVLGELEIMYPDRLTVEELDKLRYLLYTVKKLSGCFSSRSQYRFLSLLLNLQKFFCRAENVAFRSFSRREIRKNSVFSCRFFDIFRYFYCFPFS